MSMKKLFNNQNREAVERELSLVDMFHIFLKRKKLFLVNFLFFLCLGMLYNFLFYTPKYRYSAYIQLGSYVERGKMVVFQKSSNLGVLLQNVYIPRFIESYRKNRPTTPHFSINYDLNNLTRNLLVLDIVAPKMDQKTYQDLLRSFVSMIGNLEENQFQQISQQFKKHLQVLKEQVGYLQRMQSSFIQSDNLYEKNLVLQNAILVGILSEKVAILGNSFNSLQKTHLVPDVPVSIKIADPSRAVLVVFMLFAAVFVAMFLVLLIEFFDQKAST